MLMHKTLTRWITLLAGMSLIWFFMFYAGPALRDSVPDFKAYADYVEQNNLHAGAIYYTDVPIVAKGDLGYRSTVEYTPRGPVAMNAQ